MARTEAAPEAPTANDPATREVLRRLEIDVTRRLDGLLQGQHRGLRAGHGTEPGDTRLYAPGDDVRRIDWNVSARTLEPQVREAIAERELQTWIVVDRTARLAMGTARCTKDDLVLAASGTVAFVTNADGNRLGAVLATTDGVRTVPARSGRRHLLRVLDDVATTAGDAAGAARRPEGGDAGPAGTDLAAALERVGVVARRRGLVVVISDFLRPPSDLVRPLGVLSQRHDVVAVRVVDPLELALPDVGRITISDPASGVQRVVHTGKARVRDAYADDAAAHRAAVDEVFRRFRVDVADLSTDRPWLDDMVRFLSGRRQRLTGAAR